MNATNQGARTWRYQIASMHLLAVLTMAIQFGCNSSSSQSETASSNAANGKGVAATVNGEPITWTEIDSSVNQQAAERSSTPSVDELVKLRAAAVDTAIERVLAFQRARKENLLPSEDEVTRYLNEKKVQSGMSDDQYQKRLTETATTQVILRDDARKSLAIQRLQEKLTVEEKISDKEVEDFYSANPSRFVTPKGVGLAVIVVKGDGANQPVNTSDGSQVKSRIDGVYQRLRSGGDFALIAKSESDDKSSARVGGDIGFFSDEDLKKRGFPEDLIRDLFAMNIGDITKPVYNQGVWCIFKLNIKNSNASKPTLDTPGVRGQIVKTLMNQRKGAADRALLEQEKGAAKIVKFPYPN